MKYGIIYKVTNLLNNKEYIGLTTTSIQKRWKMHKTASRKNRSNSILHEAIAKYGPESFSIVEICSCLSKEELDIQEEYFINKFNTLVPNGYNLKTGGANGKHTEACKEKMSKIRQKMHQDPEFSEYISKNLFDYTNNLTDEERKLHGQHSTEYWSKEENRADKALVEKTRWEDMSEEEKASRTKGFREYWTPELLEKHGKIMAQKLKGVQNDGLKAANEKKSVKVFVKELSTGKETVFPSLAKCVKSLRISFNTLNEILSGKRPSEYDGFRIQKL